MRKTGMKVSLMMQNSSTITSTEESNRIHHEYSAHFEKVEEQQYSPYHTVQGVKYMIPEPDYYHSNAQPKQDQKQQNQNVYLPPPPSIEDICTWYGRGRGRARHLELHGHRLYGEKMRSLESPYLIHICYF